MKKGSPVSRATVREEDQVDGRGAGDRARPGVWAVTCRHTAFDARSRAARSTASGLRSTSSAGTLPSSQDVG